MKKLLVISYWLLVGTISKSHPGIGIVKDQKGNIYYTDLAKVWKISLDGIKSVVVTGVHTHELFIDEQDNLYGEHLWYNGESKDTWGHYVWCLKNTGELVKETEPAAGFLTNYSFTRDSLGNMYWVERFTISRIMKKTTSGEVVKIVEGKFGFIGWLTAAKNGTLFFTGHNKLYKLSPESKSDSYRLETIAENIGSKSTDFSIMGRNYDSYGIWTDDPGNVYLAMMDSKTVIRVGLNGHPETIFESDPLWIICSGLFDTKGNMWVLETTLTNEVRARKITKEDLAGNKTAASVTTKPHLFITVFTLAAIILLFLIVRRILNKRKHKLQQFAI